jgi:hypothetical protein
VVITVSRRMVTLLFVIGLNFALPTGRANPPSVAGNAAPPTGNVVPDGTAFGGNSPDDNLLVQNPLYAFAVGYARGRGYRFGSGANQTFFYSTARALLDIKTHPELHSSSEARRNVALFIDAMISASYSIPNYDAGVIGEQTEQKARSTLCPLWPFC